ncbi:MAG: 16S rRNA (guanine(966)-N(2))-methyltransferase RsmD [Actinobacteria bacterium]|nr:16S rRNA (guanine(966)-N(2))-methyltransferase RsmD [Actinomycetota bacterium]
MRIIAGRYKGTRLFTPHGNWMRPTSDRVREFIFSRLADSVVSARVLDLFAGTGSFGLEALSRGADKVSFVDRSSRAIQVLQKNINKIKVSADVYRMHETLFLKNAANERLSFDLIFCDPPYHYNDFGNVATLVFDSKIISPGGMLIYESSSRRQTPDAPGFTVEKEKILGDTKVTFFLANE